MYTLNLTEDELYELEVVLAVAPQGLCETGLEAKVTRLRAQNSEAAAGPSAA